jgi:FixJ family two-component response regulator
VNHNLTKTGIIAIVDDDEALREALGSVMKMSGIELQRRLAESNSRLPIIFVTAHGDASLRDSLMRAGAVAFFYKPVRSDALLREIHTALGSTSTHE